MTKNPNAPTPAREDDCFLPNFCSAQPVFLLVMIAELLAFIVALASSAYSKDLWGDLALVSLFIQWVALGSAGLLCLGRRWLGRMREAYAALTAYGLALLVTKLCSLLIVGAIAQDFIPLDLEPGWAQRFIIRNLAISAIVWAIALRYFYVQHHWKRNMEAEARARVQALQARIRPHFLFNSMNTIASLTRSQPPLAERAVEDLSDLFRTTLGNKERSTLAEELDIARRYLNIEALRLGERLEVRWALADDLPMDAPLPTLIIQPLVENAIYHGIERLTQGGRIDIAARRNGALLDIRVVNPRSAAGSPRNGNHMAQENIRQRLRLAYGEKGRMLIEAEDQKYTVTLHIPLEAA